MRRFRHWLILGAAALSAAVILFQLFRPAQAQQIKREDLRPGLVAIHRDGGKGEFQQLEPAVALQLKAGETAHPTLNSKGGSSRWEGFLNVLRAGDYQFSTILAGSLKVKVAGKEVLAGNNENVVTFEVAPVRLEAGIHPIEVEFSRSGPEARVELFWKSPNILKEPVPHYLLKHLPENVPAKFSEHQLVERGRFLVEELGCVNCHKPGKDDKVGQGLHARKGPDLTKVSQRKEPGYLWHWLNAERNVQIDASRSMPHLLSTGKTGEAEAFALAKYLESLGGAIKPSKVKGDDKGTVASIDRGKKLFITVGCSTCHSEQENAAANETTPIYSLASTFTAIRHVPLKNQGQKTTPEALANYLQNPAAHAPLGRMPSLNLDGKEAADLANYLCFAKERQTGADAPNVPPIPPANRLALIRSLVTNLGELQAIDDQPEAKQWSELGKRLVATKGCANCHTITPDSQTLRTLEWGDLHQHNVELGGCLALDPSKAGKAPQYSLTKSERAAIVTFLAKGSGGTGTPSPAHAARVALQRFNCLACHTRDGEGGLTEALTQELRKYEKPENAETVTPPNLTGVAHKLRGSWLQEVLTKGGKARPWMSLRMPQFGEAHVGKLPEALAALEGTDTDDTIHKVEITNAKIVAGKALVGKAAFGCISCHDIAGIPNSGTRGPDLASTTNRVRYDWYRRWLESAQRMDPGTKMPSYFTEGKSTFESILGGHGDAQAEAMWAYMSLGPTLPLPEGLLIKGGQYVLTVTDKTQWLRTFLPEAGSKAFVVGFPGAISAAFDAQQCRLSFGWTGPFVDVAPVWANRGGAPAKVLGPKFWTAPAGCPWGVTDSAEPPNFAAIAKDPAYGAPLPEGKIFEGQYVLNFEGFTTDSEGMMIFRYRLDAGKDKTVKITERPEALRSAGAVGLGRRFKVDLPAGSTAWLHVADSDATPKIYTDKGELSPGPGPQDTTIYSSPSSLIVLPQPGGKALVLNAPQAPDKVVWHAVREGKTWKVLLRLTGGAQPVQVQGQVNIWSAVREEPALLRELKSSK